jgi:hypothetical protein
MEHENLNRAAELAKVYSMPGEWIIFEHSGQRISIKLGVHYGSGKIAAERIPLMLNRTYIGKNMKETLKELALRSWVIKERKPW